MPELPEVQNFRRLLLPLVSEEHPLRLERQSLEKAPPRKFINDEEIESIHSSGLLVSEVLRKGKLICMVLQNAPKREGRGRMNKPDSAKATTKYLFLHMGMTGRISNPRCIPKLQELSDTDIYPPPYTYLKLVAGPNEACFSDPRKFGAIFLKDSLDDDFGVLAPDAWTSTGTSTSMSTCTMKAPEDSSGDNRNRNRTEAGAVLDEDNSSTIAQILGKLTHQSMGIKGILLDQKRAVCGVGNWVADEVLYQTKLHPDQNYLTSEQARILIDRLHAILDEAVRCLSNDEDFPREWLFHYRWSKRGSNKATIKDARGRSIVFVTSGGRTSAVVPSIQKKKSQKPANPSSSHKQASAKKPAKTEKRTRSASKPESKARAKVKAKSSQKAPAIKSDPESKTAGTTETTEKTESKSIAIAIKNEKASGANKSSGRGRKRKDAPGEAAVGIRRGTRRSPRLAKS
mmetsp:Transcript_572/g.1176  ORF Transcript_572/g.1176 Transcript_572/m.1176 type:complete len:458 (+) Transcript_572:318-1691(+)